MNIDSRSTVPCFSVAGVTFECWVTDAGHRYEWRSTCKRAAAGRQVALCWAVVDGRRIGDQYETLRRAMLAAVVTMRPAEGHRHEA